MLFIKWSNRQMQRGMPAIQNWKRIYARLKGLYAKILDTNAEQVSALMSLCVLLLNFYIRCISDNSIDNHFHEIANAQFAVHVIAGSLLRSNIAPILIVMLSLPQKLMSHQQDADHDGQLWDVAMLRHLELRRTMNL